MFRLSLLAAAACFFMTAWPDTAQAQRWRYNRGFVGAPGVSVGYGNYYGNYGYSPYYYNRGWYGYSAAPNYYSRGWYGYPTSGVYYSPNYYSGYTTSPVYYNSPSYAYQANSSGTTTSFYNGPPMNDNLVRVRVILPDANARLMVQDQHNQSTGIERTIVSPPLTVGTNYHYTFQATWRDANGQDVTRERRIDVVPGQQYTVDFNQQ